MAWIGPVASLAGTIGGDWLGSKGASQSANAANQNWMDEEQGLRNAIGGLGPNPFFEALSGAKPSYLAPGSNNASFGGGFAGPGGGGGTSAPWMNPMGLQQQPGGGYASGMMGVGSQPPGESMRANPIMGMNPGGTPGGMLPGGGSISTGALWMKPGGQFAPVPGSTNTAERTYRNS